MSDKFVILTSVMGLGTYIPALHLRDFFCEKGKEVSIALYEEFFSEAVKKEYLLNKEAYHRSMKIAVLGHKMAASRLKTMIDGNGIGTILEGWRKEGIHNFIILSGNWIEIVEKYHRECVYKINAFIVHMDIGVAPSWKLFQNRNNFFVEIFPFNQKGVNYVMENHFQNNISENSTEKVRVFVHGGGWGMGNYQLIVSELKNNGNMEVISAAYAESEISGQGEYCLLETDWQPWHLDEMGRHQYPLMKQGKGQLYEVDNTYSNGLYSLYRSCDAIISKPGGATLMDSLITGVPIVFIDPIAEHEKENQKVWESLGLGISYSVWKENEYSRRKLSQLKNNIFMISKGKEGIGQRILSILEGTERDEG